MLSNPSGVKHGVETVKNSDNLPELILIDNTGNNNEAF